MAGREGDYSDNLPREQGQSAHTMAIRGGYRISERGGSG